MDYIFHITVILLLFLTLAASLDLLIGHAGVLALSQAAFYGIGAYTSALLSVHFNLAFSLCFLSAVFVACIISIIISVPTWRLNKDYFAICTFGFQMVIYSIFNNWMSVTRGPLGIPGIPQPVIFGWNVNEPWKFVILALIWTILSYWVIWRITKSPLGRVLHAIREDEVFAQALGKDTLRVKVLVFATSAILAGGAGSLYAHYMTYIEPTSFSLNESILILSMVIIGGSGSPLGPLLGTFILVCLPEVLRYAGFPISTAAHLRQIIYGGLLVIMMMFRPRGFLGKYNFES